MNTKQIKKSNARIARTENIFNKLVTFLKTNTGLKFVQEYAKRHQTLDALLDKYNLQYIRGVGLHPKQIGTLRVAIEKAGRLRCLDPIIIDYTKLGVSEAAYDKSRERFVAGYRKTKPPVRLTKFEQKCLNKRDQWSVKIDENGKPVIATDVVNGELRLLFDKITGRPIYKYTPKNNKIGMALKLHMLEVHKMERYDRKHPIPTLEELNNQPQRDLFPDMIIAAHKQLREAHVEQVRKDLIDLYCPVSVEARVANRKTDNVRSVECAKIKLGKTRSELLHCERPLRSDLKHRLRTALDIAINNHPGENIACLKLHTHDKRTDGLIIFPDKLKMAA